MQHSDIDLTSSADGHIDFLYWLFNLSLWLTGKMLLWMYFSQPVLCVRPFLWLCVARQPLPSLFSPVQQKTTCSCLTASQQQTVTWISLETVWVDSRDTCDEGEGFQKDCRARLTSGLHQMWAQMLAVCVNSSEVFIHSIHSESDLQMTPQIDWMEIVQQYALQ